MIILQSVNEELHTVNVEHQSKIREVSEINADMRELLESTGEAIVLLDRQLCIKRFTSLASTLFNLLPQDVGRPLTNFRHPLHYPELIADIQACHDTQKTSENYVTAADGGYYLVRIGAYPREAEGQKGVVLSIRDLSALREAQKQVELLSSIVASSRDAVIALDPKRRIIVWNDAATSLYGYKAEDVLGSAFDVIVPPARRAELDHVLKNAIDVASRPYGKSSFLGKPVGIIGNSPGPLGGVAAVKTLQNILPGISGPIMGQPEAYLNGVGDAFDDKGVLIKESLQKVLQQYIDAFAVFIEKQNR